MRPKSIAVLLLALGCGLVAMLGFIQLSGHTESVATTGETQPVFVAMTDVGLGDLLTSQVLKLQSWPKDKVPPGAVSRIEDVEGRRVRAKLYAGEPILESKLLGKGANDQGATSLIPKGYRVVTVRVDLVSGAGSLILPGDRVDVMVHLVRDLGREINETVTRTILQDIKVFAVNDVVDLEKDKEGGKSIAAKTISLLVTPDQGAKVIMASQMGSINLVMRSSEDDRQTPDAQARPRELFAASAKGDPKNEVIPMPAEPNVANQAKSFAEYLNSMKKKPVPDAASPKAENAKPRNTWTIRMIKPGTIEEVQLETDPANSTSTQGTWKATPVGSTVVRPANGEPKAIEPPAAAQLLQPAPEPRQPKNPPKMPNKDKNATQPPAAA